MYIFNINVANLDCLLSNKSIIFHAYIPVTNQFQPNNMIISQSSILQSAKIHYTVVMGSAALCHLCLHMCYLEISYLTI